MERWSRHRFVWSTIYRAYSYNQITTLRLIPKKPYSGYFIMVKTAITGITSWMTGQLGSDRKTAEKLNGEGKDMYSVWTLKLWQHFYNNMPGTTGHHHYYVLKHVVAYASSISHVSLWPYVIWPNFYWQSRTSYCIYYYHSPPGSPS